jgi:hypothetical protein
MEITTTTESTTTTTMLTCPTCNEWIHSSDPCNVGVCQAGCDMTNACAASRAVDQCGTNQVGLTCCAFGSSCAAAAEATCSTEATNCEAN